MPVFNCICGNLLELHEQRLQVCEQCGRVHGLLPVKEVKPATMHAGWRTWIARWALKRRIAWLLEQEADNAADGQTGEQYRRWEYGAFVLRGVIVSRRLAWATLHLSNTLVAEWRNDSWYEYHTGKWETVLGDVVRTLQEIELLKKQAERDMRFMPLDQLRKQDDEF